MSCLAACQFDACALENERMTNKTATDSPEPWLRGTLTEWPPVPRALLHSLELAKEDLWKWCHPLSESQLNQRIGNSAPVAFHLRHIARSLDRLLTYAESRQLNDQQLAALRSELDANATHAQLFAELEKALARSADRVRELPLASTGSTISSTEE
jgi:hypothetical protein